MSDRYKMCDEWYNRVPQSHPNIARTDFRIARPYRRKIVRRHLLAFSLAELLKDQRLFPNERAEIDDAVNSGTSLDKQFLERIRWILAEGILKDDLKTVNDDAFTGTCGQLLFQWIRNQYYGDEIIYSAPRLLSDSSTKQGTDYFEILGNPNDADSLYFIAWEVKATDGAVRSRTDEIYQMHKRRTSRLLRGLQIDLSLEYSEDTPVGEFARHLLDHWQSNTARKRIGGAVVFDTSMNPGNVFTTFHTQFPELHSDFCRQVILVEVPRFRKMRRKLWRYLQSQMF